jgi:FkbM family methyltransferase
MSDPFSLRIYYGTLEKNVDITMKVQEICRAGDYLVIPADDNLRAKIFTDPCFGIVKCIIISGLSNVLHIFNQATTILLDTNTNQVVQNIPLTRRLIKKTGMKMEEKLHALHSLLVLKEGSMKEEYPEQCMVMEYFTGKEKVLEIGGNIGRNSLLMSSLLDDPSQLVVLESSPDIAKTLEINRNLNGMPFQIENSALSARKLIQKAWTTIPSDEVLEGYTEVPTITYPDLMAKYKIAFDTLILDCEGAFYYILTDYPEILDNVKTIITENDYRNLDQKAYVANTLKEKGFKSVYIGEGGEEPAYYGFTDLADFYQVWQRPSVPSVSLVPSAPNTTVITKGAKFMEKYPCVIFFRYDKYSAVDAMFDDKDKLECSIQIVSSWEQLANLYDCNYPVFVTYGETEEEYFKDVYRVITSSMNRRWIHHKEITSVEDFVRGVNHCYIHNVLHHPIAIRPTFSIFTTCYNSYDKINRAYDSIVSQGYRDWEWVILDDSPDDKHFAFLKKKFSQEKKVRLYKRSCNSGNIGNVKNEAVSLCRGQYVLEMDHDDEILPHTIGDAVRAFEEDPEVGFVYMDFINIYENGKNFCYSDFISKGYGGYYMEKFRGVWRFVYMTPNMNNITMSHIVCLPNHPRIWRKDVLMRIGNYSEFLPICDDQEVLMRTALATKMVKIPKHSYVQYMNEGNNNFSLIRNREINRLGPQFIVPQFFDLYKVNDRMKELGAYEDEKYIVECVRLWTRDNYEHKYCNKRVLYDYDTQYCIVGCTAFMKNFATIQEAYQNPRNDFLLLDGSGDREALCTFLDTMNCPRMKCYTIKDLPPNHLKNYFNYLYKTCESTVIIEEL